MWKKKSSPKGTHASKETAVHTACKKEELNQPQMNFIHVDIDNPHELTTTAANGAREKPFPSLSTISASMLCLLTKQRTKTAMPTPASITSWEMREGMISYRSICL